MTVENNDKLGATFVGDLYDCRTKKDGGGRLQIDFGADALAEIQWLQKVAAFRGGAFQIAIVPIKHGAQFHETESD
jgi:hypothetical protein